MNLTQSQLAVCRRLAMGECNKEIAKELGVSYNTVRTHIANALHRTGARNRVALAVMVAQR